MPIEATLLLRDPGIPVPIYEVDVSVFALPAEGDGWWRETFAATVTDVEDDGVPRITIERDPDVTRDLYSGLPDGAQIGANLDPNTGIWQVHVEGSGGQILGVAQGQNANEGVFDVVGRARAEAITD